MEHISRNAAFELLKKYNKDPFHIQHALTVEAVMKWYANELGYGDDAQYWGIVGLLHDIDFELYLDQHCIKAPELLREGGVSEDIIHGVVSHGYGITVDVAPEHEMEKVLFAADELTGRRWAAALMRPSKSTKDMELKSLKKKYKSKGFAAGCSREVIERGAQQLGWELEKLLTMTLAAMAASDANLKDIRNTTKVQTIGHDKVNQLRHVRFFKDMPGMYEHMRKHAAILRPKFEKVEDVLEKEIGGLGIGTWTKPLGGYFISFDSMDGCAKAIVAKAKEAGLIMTGAGATFPYGKDPKDSNIRIAPSFPTVEELAQAAEIFVLSVKLVSVEKLLGAK